jgi:NADP-dependent 3-hydroxy acid dehydrogenase YdfG
MGWHRIAPPFSGSASVLTCGLCHNCSPAASELATPLLAPPSVAVGGTGQGENDPPGTRAGSTTSKGGGFRVEPVLQGTVALVTGASSGIGAATAAALADQGAAVALAARRRDRLEALAATITGQGGTALVLECDVTDQQQAAAAVERTAAELGRLDTLINNAGVMLLGPIVGAPLAEWQQMVELNVLGLLYCAHAALPHLLRAAETGPRQVADMVNISSVAGRAARNGNGVYSLTKFGVGAFSESLRQEVAKRYLRVSLVEPGATATELASHNRPEVLESIRSQFGQTMAAEDIASAIAYIVTRPRHVAVNEVLIRPTEQER